MSVTAGGEIRVQPLVQSRESDPAVELQGSGTVTGDGTGGYARVTWTINSQSFMWLPVMVYLRHNNNGAAVGAISYTLDDGIDPTTYLIGTSLTSVPAVTGHPGGQVFFPHKHLVRARTGSGGGTISIVAPNTNLIVYNCGFRAYAWSPAVLNRVSVADLLLPF